MPADGNSPAGSDSIRWGRVLGALVLAAFLIELGGRIVIRVATNKPFVSLNYYRWSPYGLVRNNPKLTHREFVINDAGMRSDRPASREKPPGTLRVIVLGGSVAWSGFGRVVHPNHPKVTSAQTIAQHLEESLRHDPRLAGINVEVLNAAVNFNRIPEVVSGYLTEWIGWNPDLVIVMGSANNFGYAPLRGQVDRREVGILQPHAWFLEFDRQANGTSLGAFGERVIRAIADHSAAAALVRRFLPQFVDAALTWSRSNSTSNAIPAYPSVGPVASFDEYDRYVKEYLAYAAALTGAARVQGQQVAFFWEYWIAHLGGIRPFNQEEELLYRANRVFHRPEDRDYDFRARDLVRDFASREGAFFIDPLERLKTEPSTVFTDYLHYTSNGNAVMADEVHRQLESWLQARARAIRNAAFSSDPAPAR